MKRNYTFVVGAGASFEFGFPTGKSLTEEISKILKFSADDFGRISSGDNCLRLAIERIPFPEDGKRWNLDYLFEAARQISLNMGLAPSIDNYLEAKKELIGYSEIGKLAIARALLSAERKSALWFDWRKGRNQAPNFASFKANWLTNLFQILSAEKGFEGFCDALKTIRFVTFNYDRVVEKFFFEAIRSYFSKSENETTDAINENLNVVHVYGNLGPLFERNAVEFGDSEQHASVYRAGTNIRTFSEGVEAQDRMRLAKEWLADSDIILFIGFGFLPLNLEAMAPKGALKSVPVYCTAYGLSSDNIEISRNILQHRWFGGQNETIFFRNVECHKLISDISGVLSEADIF